MRPIDPIIKDFQKIIERYLDGKATKEEIRFLDNYEAYLDTQSNVTSSFSPEQKENLKTQMSQKVFAHTKPKQSFIKTLSLGTKWMAAASLLLVLGTAFWFLLDRNPDQELAAMPHDRNPASSGAILTLADGSVINLDSNNAEQIQQGEVKVSVNNGQLAYAGNNLAHLYNTIATPKGGFYQLTLADGTKVWLNTASSLRYPVAFEGNERKVVLSGEAYFEVAKNKTPFRVDVAGKGEVEVLGTHFNVKAYTEEEKLVATLLEGKVKVSPLVGNEPDAKKGQLLSAGQQAIVADGKTSLKTNPDLDRATAWKNGKFYFEDEKLETILQEMSRWYDIDVVYQAGADQELKERKFFMIVDRHLPLSEVLKSLQDNGVKFKIQNKQLMIY